MLVDPSFEELPRGAVVDAALQAALDRGASHVDIRIQRHRKQSLEFSDARLRSRSDEESVGFGVRVLYKGTWGFAAGIDLTADEAARVGAEAVAIARLSEPLNSELVRLPDERAVTRAATWVSSYTVDPFRVSNVEKIGRIRQLCETLLASPPVDHVDGDLAQVMENKFYADTRGVSTSQQRVRIACRLEIATVDAAHGQCVTLRTLAPPVGRGWEWMVGGPRSGNWDWDREIGELPTLLAEKAAAPRVTAGSYDLVVDPTNLWLAIHETVGHATELDRILGYEAAYAGTSFVTLDQIGKLQYGSPKMTVTADRTVDHGLATIGFDDEGVPAQQWDIIRGGRLVGFQLDRQMAARGAALLGSAQSNGCAFADAPHHPPCSEWPTYPLERTPEAPPSTTSLAACDEASTSWATRVPQLICSG